MKNSVKLPFVTKNSKHLVGTGADDLLALIALIRDDVRKISRNIKPRLGGDRFAWFVAM